VKREEPPLPLWTQIDMEDLAVGNAMLHTLREAQKLGSQPPQAAAAEPGTALRARAAGQGCEQGCEARPLQGQGDAAPLQRQGALFDFSRDAFDSE
jgi:hypothetical protein